MIFASENASAVYRALGKCCQEVAPEGKWQWQCALLNGARLPVAASLREGFLSLECGAEITVGSPSMMKRAISANTCLHNGVKLVLDAASRCLRLHSDIAVLSELQLLARLQWSMDGLHHGTRLLACLCTDCTLSPELTEAAAPEHLHNLEEFIRDSNWQLAKRGPNEFAVELESDSAPPALVRIDERGIAASVELVRCSRPEGAVPDALTIYLLTVTRTTRLVRATRLSGNQDIFALQAGLPASSAAEELAHALAALSVAHRACAREANVLLNEAAARCYLAARDRSIDSQSNQ